MITESWLKAQVGKVRPSQTIKSDRDGLGARVSPKGKVTWQLRYYHNGKQQRVDLGTYPIMGLKAAREESARLRGELEKGRDPKVVKNLELHAAANPETFEAVFRKWYDAYCSTNKVGHAEILRSFEIHVFPKYGNLPVDEISSSMWADLIENLSIKSESIAARVLVNAKQCYRWAARRKLVTANPVEHISARHDFGIKKKSNSRTFSDDEISKFFLGLYGSRIAQKNKLFLHLCLFYGCRNGEMRLAEKGHFDFDEMTWTVPPENHKTGHNTEEKLVRPIIPEIVPMLEEAMALSPGSAYLFNNVESRKNKDGPMGKGAPLQLPYNIMQWLRRHESYEMEHWSVHDLRRTARTNFSTLTLPHIAEIMLGHKLPGEWGTYDKYKYLPEQTEAYQKWWERLEGLRL